MSTASAARRMSSASLNHQRSFPVKVFAALFAWVIMLAVGLTAAEATEVSIDADRQFGLAEECFVANDYDQARMEFKRFTFFFPDDPRSAEALFYIGKCFLETGDYRAAIRIFRELTDTFPAYRLQAYTMISRAYLAMGQTGSAAANFHNIIALAENESDRDAARYQLGWLYLENIWAEERRAATPPFETALRYFQEISPEGQSRFQLNELSAQLARQPTIPRKNSWLAGALSVLPGGGQLYCGRYQDALAAFLLNAGLIFSAVEAFDHELYALGSVVSVVGSGFYVGNIYGAVSSAKKYNRAQKRSFVKNMKESFKVDLTATPAKERIGASVGFSF